MKESNDLILLVSLLMTLLMATVSYLNFKRNKSLEFSHLLEFWTALFVQVLTMFICINKAEQIIVLSMVGWVWPFRSMQLVLEDVSGQSVSHWWTYWIVGLAAFVSISLGGYGFSFLAVTLPFSLTIGGLGLLMTYEAYKTSHFKEDSLLKFVLYFCSVLYFLKLMSFPFWIVSKFSEYVLVLETMIIVGFAGTIVSVYMEIMNKKHVFELDSIIKERNQKLLSQSKYSELGMMSAGIAHEINNPLAVIQARTTQLLRIYRDSSRAQDLGDGLQQILYTSERIARTIQGVREFVHQDEQCPMKEINLKVLVDDVLAFCGQRLKNHGVNLRFYGLENYSVYGNKIQLEQIILNLLNNSFDAIEFLADKWIEISVHEKNNRLQILVKDSGHGIPEEVATRIMEPFFTTKNLGKGTGLGLSLARGIAEKHGGNLCYLKNKAHTTFMLELPKNMDKEGRSSLVH